MKTKLNQSQNLYLKNTKSDSAVARYLRLCFTQCVVKYRPHIKPIYQISLQIS